MLSLKRDVRHPVIEETYNFAVKTIHWEFASVEEDFVIISTQTINQYLPENSNSLPTFVLLAKSDATFCFKGDLINPPNYFRSSLFSMQQVFDSPSNSKAFKHVKCYANVYRKVNRFSRRVISLPDYSVNLMMNEIAFLCFDKFNNSIDFSYSIHSSVAIKRSVDLLELDL